MKGISAADSKKNFIPNEGVPGNSGGPDGPGGLPHGEPRGAPPVRRQGSRSGRRSYSASRQSCSSIWSTFLPL